MKKRVASLGISTVILMAGFTISHEARANPSCSGGTSCSDCCLAWTDSTTGDTGIYTESTGGLALNAQDVSSGIGANGYSASGIGVFGGADNSGFTQPSGEFGGYFYAPGNGGTGTNAALYGNATGTSGTGVLGTGYAYGVYGSTTGSGGIGVAGYSTSTGAGVYGHASGSHGVFGYCTSNSYAGVLGENSGSGDGVQGNSVSGYAGNFTKGSGKLDAGIYYWNGNCFENCGSDIRLKKNVEPLTSALDTLLQLRGVTFDWKNPEEQGEKQRGRQRGFIAQEVENTFPEWVGEDSKGFKTIAITPTQIAALEVESFRTLKMEHDVLAEQVKELRSGRQMQVSGINLNGVGFGVGGIAIGLGLYFGMRRKQGEAKA